MSTLLITRANRALLIGIASLLMLSLVAPIVALASTDLVAGDSAVVVDGGANLRSDTATLDDSTIIAEMPAGTTAYVIDNPVYNDTGVWVYVATDGFGPGWVSASLLQKQSVEAPLTEEVPAEEPAVATSELAWLEPIDSAYVVDYNKQLTEQGLPVLAAASLDAQVLGYVHVGTTLDVTEARVWIGDYSFVRVNYNGMGAYVDGRYVELASEAVAEEPVEEIVYIEETEVPVETEVVEAPVETEVVEAPVETEVVEAPVETEVVEAPVETEVVEAPVETEVVETVAATAEVIETEVVETEVAETEVATEAPAETEAAATAEVVETEVATEAPVETEVAATAEVVETEEATAAPTQIATEAPTVAPTESPKAEPAASTQPAFNADAMIGSATVTGTTSGLVCRTAPDANAPVLTTLAEGTKVLVSAEAVNGYLGIDCAGLQGYADVNFLWSGGAGDDEITAAKMSVVVTGTGNGLNCRTGAGLSYPVITTLFDGTSMQTRGAASNGWTPVVCAGKNGFVSTTWIEVAGGSSNTNTGNTTTSGSAVVNTGGDGLYCRTGAGTSYSAITTLRHGSAVTVRGSKQGDWVPVVCAGQNGFAHGAYLNLSATTGPTAPSTGAPTAPSTSTGRVTVANTGGDALNCRAGAGTNFNVITSLSLGTTITTRSGSVNGWTAVVCGGTNGFVSSQYVSGATAPGTTPAPAPTTPTGMVSGDRAKTTDVMNLRYSASLSAGVSTTVPAGIVVQITGSLSNGFYPINYDGLTGFIHGDYLVKTTEAASKRGGSGTPTQPAPAPTSPSPSTGTATGNALVNYAMRYQGYPYVWATHGPSSFDCSGFTYWVVYNVTGKNIGYGTWTQVAAGTSVSRSALQPGDLVFFQNTYTAGLSHVGLYIGNNKFIHAQNEETGVVISDLDSSYYGPRWYGAVRIG